MSWARGRSRSGLRLDQRLELGHELGVTPEREIGLDPFLDATARRSSSRAISACAKGSYVKSARAGPRQRASASRSAELARGGVAGGERLAALAREPQEAVQVDALAGPARTRSRVGRVEIASSPSAFRSCET